MKKIPLLILFLFFGLGQAELGAQSLVIRLTDGSETTQLLNTVQKLSFESGDLVVSFYDGSSDIYGLSEIQKLYFETSTSVQERIDENSIGMVVYPNPAKEQISIRNIPGGTDWLRIYRSDGLLMITEPVTDDNLVINISQLSSGLYFINAQGSSKRFIKQ